MIAQGGGGYTFSHNWISNLIADRPADGTWTLTANGPLSYQFQSDPLGAATAANIVKTRNLGALLGLATDVNSPNATTITSEVGIYAYRTGDWELGDLAVNIRAFERGPA
jgi:hypothetical protein